MDIEQRNLKFMALAEWELKDDEREDVEVSKVRLVAGGTISDK